jgi:hypothetical protein
MLWGIIAPHALDSCNTTLPVPRHRSLSNVSTHVLSKSIIRVRILLPAGVPACFPAPQPNGKTNLRLPRGSSTTNASNGNLPPPIGCSSPRRTKWLLDGSTACIMGSENGAVDEGLCDEISWQRTKAWREGERV